MKPALCRNCGVPIRLPLWCAECWRQFWFGAAAAAGAIFITWLLR